MKTRSRGILGRFRNYENAKSFSAATLKMSAIVLGDDSRYWVVTLATMMVLQAHGYELAL